MWLGKPVSSTPAPDENNPATSDSMALVAQLPGDQGGDDGEGGGGESVGAVGRSGKKAKEIKDLQNYPKTLNAKTNLLDLCSEVLADKRLLAYGWMKLAQSILSRTLLMSLSLCLCCSIFV